LNIARQGRWVANHDEDEGQYADELGCGDPSVLARIVHLADFRQYLGARPCRGYTP
jgi:hypothetical protein